MTNVSLTHEQLVQLHDIFSTRVAQLEADARGWDSKGVPQMAGQCRRDVHEVKNLMQSFFGSDAVVA